MQIFKFANAEENAPTPNAPISFVETDFQIKEFHNL